MNLLEQLEIPCVIWENEALSLHEKILLAAVQALDKEEGVAVTNREVAVSLRVPLPTATRMLETLCSRGMLVRLQERDRLRLGDLLKEAIKQENQRPRFKLVQYYIQCLCLDYDLKMEYAEQIRICPNCLRAVYLTESEKRYVYVHSP